MSAISPTDPARHQPFAFFFFFFFFFFLKTNFNFKLGLLYFCLLLNGFERFWIVLNRFESFWIVLDGVLSGLERKGWVCTVFWKNMTKSVIIKRLNMTAHLQQGFTLVFFYSNISRSYRTLCWALVLQQSLKRMARDDASKKKKKRRKKQRKRRVCLEIRYI